LLKTKSREAVGTLKNNMEKVYVLAIMIKQSTRKEKE
jgi:hypothetical protein